MMLKVKLLRAGARAPECAHPGEDLGFDLFAAEGVRLRSGIPTKVPTGIAVQFTEHGMGGLIRDRSSMAAKGIFTTAGVLDWGYRGELWVVLTLTLPPDTWGHYMEYDIKPGDKIAQLIPVWALTKMGVSVVDTLDSSERCDKGFGSTGR